MDLTSLENLLSKLFIFVGEKLVSFKISSGPIEFSNVSDRKT